MDFIKYLIGILIFGIIVFNGILFMTDMDTNYGEFGANVTTDKFTALNESNKYDRRFVRYLSKS